MTDDDTEPDHHSTSLSSADEDIALPPDEVRSLQLELQKRNQQLAKLQRQLDSERKQNQALQLQLERMKQRLRAKGLPLHNKTRRSQGEANELLERYATLKDEGNSEREIATLLGVPRTTLRGYASLSGGSESGVVFRTRGRKSPIDEETLREFERRLREASGFALPTQKLARVILQEILQSAGSDLVVSNQQAWRAMRRVRPSAVARSSRKMKCQVASVDDA